MNPWFKRAGEDVFKRYIVAKLWTGRGVGGGFNIEDIQYLGIPGFVYRDPCAYKHQS